METEKLTALVLAAQNGEDNAATELYNAYQKDLYYHIYKTVNDPHLAEDLLQDAFIEILGTIQNLKEPAAFLSWSKQIAYHKCTAYFKRRRDILADENEDGLSIFDTIEEDNAEFIPDEALDKRFERLLNMRMDGEVTADVFISSSNEIRETIDRLKSEIAELTADVPEETASDYEDKIEFLKFALEQYTHFDESREIPDSVLEAFVEKIVIFEDHFEWYLRFGDPDAPTKCGVNGKSNENPTVWGEGDDPSPAGLAQHRLLLKKASKLSKSSIYAGLRAF